MSSSLTTFREYIRRANKKVSSVIRTFSFGVSWQTAALSLLKYLDILALVHPAISFENTLSLKLNSYAKVRVGLRPAKNLDSLQALENYPNFYDSSWAQFW